MEVWCGHCRKVTKHAFVGKVRWKEGMKVAPVSCLNCAKPGQFDEPKLALVDDKVTEIVNEWFGYNDEEER